MRSVVRELPRRTGAGLSNSRTTHIDRAGTGFVVRSATSLQATCQHVANLIGLALRDKSRSSAAPTCST